MEATTLKSGLDMANFNAWIAERNTQLAEENAKKRAVLHDWLISAGIDRVEADYDAYGDSGNIESVELLRKEPKVVLPEPNDAALAGNENLYRSVLGAITDDQMTWLQDFLWMVVYALHPGFENNDGGYGEIVWDLSRDAISVEHKERITDVNSYAYEDL